MYHIDNDKDDAVLREMKAGDLLHYDYRAKHEGTFPKVCDTFRVVQWNIERGVKLGAIIADLKALKADFIALQELDINCRRSDYANVPKEIAKALGAELYFVCEVEEIDAECRSAVNAVGPLSQPVQRELVSYAKMDVLSPNGRHFHGNAVISMTATLQDAVAIRHFNTIDWDQDGVDINEPRRGFRSALRVRVDASDRTSHSLAPLYIYCCHFEVFCGGLTRVRQLADCMADMHRLNKILGMIGGQETPAPAFLLAGDLNTMAHGIVRFSRHFGTDRMRFLGIGESEACWLQRKVLSRHLKSLERGCCPVSFRYPAYLASRVHQLLYNNRWVWQFLYGFSQEEITRMSNEHLCLYDPGDKVTSITLDHPSYHGYVRGKLDWMLVSNLEPVPFRTSRGGAQPVDLAALEKNASVKANSEAATYLRVIQESGQDDEAREAALKQGANAATLVPEDGYLLFNQDYTASDHRGLVMTVRQHTGKPEKVYPEYGAPYTHCGAAKCWFVLTRAVPLAILAAYVALR